MKKILLLVLVIAASTNAFTQHLNRKGGLGIGLYVNTPDSVVQRLNYKTGCVTHTIYPNTTAAAIGLQANDIIIKANDKPIIQSIEIFAFAKTLRANENVSITVLRNGKELVLKGKVVEKPKEKSETADVIYGEFAYNKGYVRTIYKTLKNKKPLGTIFFIQGLPCYSMDNFRATDITKQALDAMVDRGFAVYRMEKADMGDNEGQNSCEEMGFTEELAMYVAGYKNLLTSKNVDTSKIFLFGHSLGGIVAPILAQEFQPKGVVVYGTGFKPWLEYLMDAFLIQSQYQGEDLGMLRDTLESIKPYVYDYFYGKKTLEETVADPKGLYAMQAIMSYNPQTKLAASGRSPQFMKEVNQYNMAKHWGNYNNYVLAIYGEADMAAIHPDDHIALIDYVNKVEPKKGTFWLCPKTTHNFGEIGTMQDYVKGMKDMQTLIKQEEQKFNSKLFDYACNWMKEILAK